MNILVTGSAGFVGRNLAENLKTFLDGTNKTRTKLKIDKIYEYDRNDDFEKLDGFCQECDFGFHLAGVNRPKDPAEFKSGNYLIRIIRIHLVNRFHIIGIEKRGG